MGLTHSPHIVTDGLVFCVDPANVRSYPGTGTTLTDLKGGNNGTLTNGPTFSSNNRGIFTFDGTNDYIAVTDSSENFAFANGNFSVGGWVGNRTSGTVYIASKGINNNAGWYLQHDGSSVRFTRAFTNNGSTGTSSLSASDTFDGWRYILVTCDTTGAAGAEKIYINGSLAIEDIDTVLYDGLSTTEPLEIGRFSLFGGAFSVYGGNDSGPVHIYNKVLTADEVMQNYLATKGRYT